MKNISLSLLLSAVLISTASADNMQPVPAKKLGHSGLYIGAVGGYSFSKIPTNKKSFSANGLSGGITGGYLTTFNASPIVVGFEGTLSFNDDHGKTNWQEETAAERKEGSASFRYKNTIQILAVLGYKIDTWMPAVKAGLASSSIESDIEVKTTALPVVAGAAVDTTSQKETKRHTGLVLGAGVTKGLTDHFAVGLDYACTFYPKTGSHANFDLKSWTHNKVSVSVRYVF